MAKLRLKTNGYILLETLVALSLMTLIIVNIISLNSNITANQKQKNLIKELQSVQNEFESLLATNILPLNAEQTTYSENTTLIQIALSNQQTLELIIKNEQ